MFAELTFLVWHVLLACLSDACLLTCASDFWCWHLWCDDVYRHFCLSAVTYSLSVMFNLHVVSDMFNLHPWLPVLLTLLSSLMYWQFYLTCFIVIFNLRFMSDVLNCHIWLTLFAYSLREEEEEQWTSSSNHTTPTDGWGKTFPALEYAHFGLSIIFVCIRETSKTVDKQANTYVLKTRSSTNQHRYIVHIKGPIYV